MILESGHIHHVYNQGNNGETVFYTRANYLFFLEKIRKHILPFVDIIAWCLMPTHFHLLVYVKHDDDLSNLVLPKRRDTNLNKEIGIMLASYCRAINIQENRTGSLFRSATKSKYVTNVNWLTPSFFQTFFGTQINVEIPEKEYPKLCFDYIHFNPVRAGLVKNPEDWEFSSYLDYYGGRDGKLVNKERALEFFQY